METQTREQLFSDKIVGKGKTYFIDVKRSARGEPYLVITETSRRDGVFQRQRITVFKEQLGDLRNNLRRAFEVMAQP